MDFGAANCRRLGESIHLKIFASILQLFTFEATMKDCYFRLKVGNSYKLKISLATPSLAL